MKYVKKYLFHWLMIFVSFISCRTYLIDKNSACINGHDTYIGANANDFRLGALYFGYQNYQLGINSEGVRYVYPIPKA